MSFRTELHPPSLASLPLNTRFVSIGSCFANTMGQKLSDYKFQCLTNPFGILYNPVSLGKVITGQLDPEEGILERQGIYLHYDLHSDIRSTSEDQLLTRIEQLKAGFNDTLPNTDVMIITLGTAFVYERVENGAVVANCHKVPQQHFTKRLLSAGEISKALGEIHAHAVQQNHDMQIIVTVSPVRHIKDTIPLNSVSKSLLRVACHEWSEKHENVHYFPAYELMMDDLRDYRFYKDDLLHPTEFAENYIWEKFTQAIFGHQALSFLEEWNKVRAALHHRPFNPDAEEHQRFLRTLLEQLQRLQNMVDCKEELEQVKAQMR